MRRCYLLCLCFIILLFSGCTSNHNSLTKDRNDIDSILTEDMIGFYEKADVMLLTPLLAEDVKKLFAFQSEDNILSYKITDDIKTIKIDLWKATRGTWKKQNLLNQASPTNMGTIVTRFQEDKIQCFLNDMELDKGKVTSLSTVEGEVVRPQIKEDTKAWTFLTHSTKIMKGKPIEFYKEMSNQDGIEAGGYLEAGKVPNDGYMITVTFE